MSQASDYRAHCWIYRDGDWEQVEGVIEDVGENKIKITYPVNAGEFIRDSVLYKVSQGHATTGVEGEA